MNFFTTRLSFFLLGSSCIFFLHAMEIQEIQKPIIKGFICPVGPLGYETQKYHDNFHSITNSFSTIFTPVIEVNVAYISYARNKVNKFIMGNWIEEVPKAIQKYEKYDWRTGYYYKKFPQYVPITLFYNKQEGDVLSLCVHGYEAHLTCTSQLPKKIYQEGFGYKVDYDKTKTTTENNFNALFNSYIKNFKLIRIRNYDKNFVHFLIDHKIIGPKIIDTILTDSLGILICTNTFNHGENGFKDLETSMIQLIMHQLKQKKSQKVFMCFSKILLLLNIKNAIENGD